VPPVAGVHYDIFINNNADLYELIERTQIEGPWPIDHPLPLPRWASKPKDCYQLGSLTQYEKLAGSIEMHVQRLLEEHNYNTVGNFVDLYQNFKKSGYCTFFKFFQRYNTPNPQISTCHSIGVFHSYAPPITPDHHTCVGLALELWSRLHQLELHFPELSKHLFLVSCEENIEALSEYTALSERLDTAAYDLEKEHVLLCLRFQINERQGLLLCDPGYHVSRVVTVMQDRAYPNTGWFIQSEENNICKEYNYQFSPMNDKFVEWNERTTRNGIQEAFTGLIYVAHPYATAVDVTERRNLVYNFRSLLSRDQKGHLIAGIYFKVKENCDEFTIFYQDMGKQRIKMKFSTFTQPFEIKEKALNIITICNEQLNLPEGSLLNILRQVGELMNDKSYLRQLLEVNDSVNIMSANN
jgi:hypothetical protein